MERLPYIDEHAISVAADPADTWRALLKVVCREPRDPLGPPVAPTGFVIDEATPPTRLVLRGRHPFAVYRLVFDLTEDGPHRTRVSATTWAAFPGLHGRIYRGLVIGSGGHWVVVGLMLRRIAAAALARHRRRGETAHVD
jgi:hypothetical protein